MNGMEKRMKVGRRRRKRTSKSNHDAAKKLLICVAKYGSKSRDS